MAQQHAQKLNITLDLRATTLTTTQERLDIMMHLLMSVCYRLQATIAWEDILTLP